MGQNLGRGLDEDGDRKPKGKGNEMVGASWVRDSSLPEHCCCGIGPCRSHRCWWPQIQSKH